MCSVCAHRRACVCESHDSQWHCFASRLAVENWLDRTVPNCCFLFVAMFCIFSCVTYDFPCLETFFFLPILKLNPKVPEHCLNAAPCLMNASSVANTQLNLVFLSQRKGELFVKKRKWKGEKDLCTLILCGDDFVYSFPGKLISQPFLLFVFDPLVSFSSPDL